MGKAINWAHEVEQIAGPFSGNRKGWLSTAARRAGVTYRQIKALYYGEIVDPKLSVATSVLSAADHARIAESRRDMARLADIYQRTAETLNAVDQDFHREQIDALKHAARIVSSLDSTGT